MAYRFKHVEVHDPSKWRWRRAQGFGRILAIGGPVRDWLAVEAQACWKVKEEADAHQHVATTRANVAMVDVHPSTRAPAPSRATPQAVEERSKAPEQAQWAPGPSRAPGGGWDGGHAQETKVSCGCGGLGEEGCGGGGVAGARGFGDCRGAWWQWQCQWQWQWQW